MESIDDPSWLTQQKFQKLLGFGAYGLIFETSDTTSIFEVKVNFLKLENATPMKTLAAPFHLLKPMHHKNLTKIYNVSFKDWKLEEIKILLAKCENHLTFHRLSLNLFCMNGQIPPSLCVQIETCGPDLWSWLQIRKTLGTKLFEVQYEIISGILDGLKYLHQNNIVHRHICPEAVLFSHTLTTEFILPVKVSSFQFCRRINCYDQDGGEFSKDPMDNFFNEYQAPEAYSSSSRDTCTTTFDVFSAGLLFLAVLLPPDKKMSSGMYYELVHENDTSVVPDHPEIENAKDLIIQMTQRRPADRLQNLDQVQFRRQPVSVHTSPGPGIGLHISAELTWLDETHVENFLGSGSFGFVLGTRSKEAIKFIFLSETDGPERDVERKQVTREYNTMVLAKNHANIVQILACSEQLFTSESLNDTLNTVPLPKEVNDSIYMLSARARKQKITIPAFTIKMELCGSSLREWLSEMHNKPGTPSMQNFQIEIVSNLLTGFRYLHSHKIIHRDFKPENVLFSYSPNQKYILPVKIGDFGLARFLLQVSEEKLTSRVGTNSYRAPEAERSFYGVQADIFSLGLVFWEVLQLLDPKVRRSMFYKLVHDYENHPLLVKDHPKLVNAKDLVVNMTKRLHRERLQTMEDVVLQLC
ncbi:uncharacterized protein LOC110861907 [Folsomia candida]|uniref:Interferon-induced, double-stranded RNA-activated protein kinase n=1 Tax=Folsomia candida TaxID=158441 RepID=A0A226CZB3_FOLCA|nr:uncharacterized protein LOC110861907 [Folsomia candida]OXA38293.1 Interferon-induced, double-stranded RNA-activated protein kinase [Folsomia candida]